MEVIILTSGSTWTVPPGTTKIIVECWGAGGSGRQGGGGGGAGGCYSRSTLDVASGSVHNLTWGYSNNTQGSATIFGNNLVSAPSGGTATNANGASNFIGSHIYNEVGYIGGAGGAAGAASDGSGGYVGGGGGGGAGSTGNGNLTTRPNVNTVTTGGLPKSEYGGGGATCDKTLGGRNGLNYGGGGSGGSSVFTGVTTPGVGGPGLIRITLLDGGQTVNNSSFFPFF